MIQNPLLHISLAKRLSAVEVGGGVCVLCHIAAHSNCSRVNKFGAIRLDERIGAAVDVHLVAISKDCDFGEVCGLTLKQDNRFGIGCVWCRLNCHYWPPFRLTASIMRRLTSS